MECELTYVENEIEDSIVSYPAPVQPFTLSLRINSQSLRHYSMPILYGIQYNSHAGIFNRACESMIEVDKIMPDPATIAAIVGLLTSSVGLVDKVADTYLSYRKKSAVSDAEHRSRITTSDDGRDLVALDHGHEMQRVSYKELTDRLDVDDLQYIKSIEKSMKSHKQIWESVYPQLATTIDPIVKAKLEQQLDQVCEAMSVDLVRILNFVEKTGLYLDDHYGAVRDIAARR